MGPALVLRAGFHVGEGQALSSAVFLRLQQPLEEQRKAQRELCHQGSTLGLFQHPPAPSASRQRSGPGLNYTGLGDESKDLGS